MAWRNIEINHLTIGYLILRGHDRASDQLLPPVSGASDPGTPADTDASERPRGPSAADSTPTRTGGWSRRLTDTRQVVHAHRGEPDDETSLIGFAEHLAGPSRHELSSG
jgi:hypothetical protein